MSRRTLPELQRDFPLPPGWEIDDHYSDAVEIGSARLQAEGLIAVHARSDRNATGSAVHWESAPLDRAYFELLERTSILDALTREQTSWDAEEWDGRVARAFQEHELFPKSPTPALWAYSKSNGIALHTSREEACRKARLELVERDRILRSWIGLLPPEPMPLPTLPLLRQLGDIYSFELRRFGHGQPAVAACFAFPKVPEAPFICGFGAEETIDVAALKALEECVQRMGFLWGEEIPSSDPPFEPTADYHQEVFLTGDGMERVKCWLAGAHRLPEGNGADFGTGPLLFSDLSPPHLKGRVWVMKAVGPDYYPLTFGKRPVMFQDGQLLDEKLWIHPVA